MNAQSLRERPGIALTETAVRTVLAEYLGVLERHVRPEFLLRRREASAPTADVFTGACFHRWTLRRAHHRWRLRSQIVERFADLNEDSKRLFATPETGLNG
jgi:hypothetical protein